MRRLTIAMLGACLVGVSTGLVALAQSPTPDTATTGGGPVALGGRIEVPSAGYALTVPQGWYAFDSAHPDLIEQMRAFDETTASLVPALQNLINGPYGDPPPLLAYAPFGGPFLENCLTFRGPLGTDSLEDIFEGELQLLEAEAVGDIEHSLVELPAGEASLASWAAPGPGGVLLSKSQWLLLRDGWAYVLTCTGERHSDDWLSIAETFEFLPVEE